MKEAILVFDVGKTNKKILLFDLDLHLLGQEEIRFEEGRDEDGFPCENASELETWLLSGLDRCLSDPAYQIRAVNFTTYGATLVYLDAEGKRLTPIYNYLKPLPESIAEDLYDAHGGREEFCRRTASPALGMLNSGLQLRWLKQTRPGLLSRLKHVLHLPQYLGYLLHGQAVSEHTSIGCHTAMWDFDHMDYHPWIREEDIHLQPPIPVGESFPVSRQGRAFEAGIGLHDSSASLAPYIFAAPAPFILLSTGTWCISMNPFNTDPLAAEELERDCLCFLGVHGKPVKSSRFFLGRIHDLNLARLEKHFSVHPGDYKRINPGQLTIRQIWEKGKRVFFRDRVPEQLVDERAALSAFASFEDAYLQLVTDLSALVVESVRMIIAKKDSTRHLYITGGFARNPVFCTMLALAFPKKKVFTSEMDNATSLGAALVISGRIRKGAAEQLNLHLKEVPV